MPKLIERRDEKPIYKRRCRNCKKPFKTDRPDKHFCEKSCRYEWHNYGKTPQAQMEGRLKAFMKTPAFHALIRAEIEKELRLIEKEVSTVEHVLP